MPLSRKPTVVQAVATCAFVFLSAWVVVAAWGQDETISDPPAAPTINKSAAPAAALDEEAIGDAKFITNLLNEAFRDKAIIALDETSKSVIIKASKDTTAEILRLVEALDKPKPSGSAGPMSRFLGAGAYGDTQYFHRIITHTNAREAKSDADKQLALRQVLDGIFDEDMRVREMQAKEIETRVEKLRQQYQERKKIKEQIIELQMKVLENEAAGLGFPGAGAAQFRNYLSLGSKGAATYLALDPVVSGPNPDTDHRLRDALRKLREKGYAPELEDPLPGPPKSAN